MGIHRGWRSVRARADCGLDRVRPKLVGVCPRARKIALDLLRQDGPAPAVLNCLADVPGAFLRLIEDFQQADVITPGSRATSRGRATEARELVADLQGGNRAAGE